ncbi:paraquat-inducible protein A [Glaciecola sp. 1036]|uniref:paraquat-inducible protein A n=1 Tax=Alteromonadaceae TaxID=72275 RepID=UPI003D074FA4
MALKQIACSHCDLVVKTPDDLLPHQRVYCPRCHSFLFENQIHASQKCFAYSVTALILFAVANLFPFLTFEASGVLRTITITEASFDLFLQGFWLLGFLVLAFILAVPFIYLICLILLLMGKNALLPYRASLTCAKLLTRLIPWAMADVFIIGVLVALIKVIELADIVLGIAFWAYIGFTLCFIAASLIANKYQVWCWIEAMAND